jgi:hypothetical protein
MSINIGDHNKIKNSTIQEINGDVLKESKKNFAERHPVLISVAVSITVGFLMLFHFWQDIVTWIEGLF